MLSARFILQGPKGPAGPAGHAPLIYRSVPVPLALRHYLHYQYIPHTFLTIQEDNTTAQLQYNLLIFKFYNIILNNKTVRFILSKLELIFWTSNKSIAIRIL